MSEIFETGLGITLMGMGLVFGLLVLLWGLMALLLRLDRTKPEPAPCSTAAPGTSRQPSHGEPVLASASADLNPTLRAAIMIAALQHRAVRRQQAAPAMRSYWPGSLLYSSRWVAAGRMRQNRSWPARRG
jgi:Na+-transporting methylmalonyl-CoA/oxaloacetate decarboxylase gamma subunit